VGILKQQNRENLRKKGATGAHLQKRPNPVKSENVPSEQKGENAVRPWGA